MKCNSWILMGVLVASLCLLGGCINIQQEYWLKPDGSATVGMDIGMSQALLSMGASGGSTAASPFDDLKKEFSTSNSKIKNVQIKEYTKDDLQHFSVTFDTANFEDFLKSQTSNNSGEFDISLTRNVNGNIVFKQVTQLDTAGSGSGYDAKSMAPMFKDMFWTVIVHVPQVVSSNGIRMDDSTVQWKIPMADVFAGKAPAQLTLEYSSSGGENGGLAWGLLVGMLLLLGGGAAYYFLIYRKRPARPFAPAGLYSGYPPQQPGPSGGYGPTPPAPGGPVPPTPGFPPQAAYPPAPQPPHPQYPQTTQFPQFPPNSGYPQYPGSPPLVPSQGGQSPAEGQTPPLPPNPA